MLRPHTERKRKRQRFYAKNAENTTLTRFRGGDTLSIAGNRVGFKN